MLTKCLLMTGLLGSQLPKTEIFTLSRRVAYNSPTFAHFARRHNSLAFAMADRKNDIIFH